MDYKYTLSIVIITMNRKDQLLEALQSCIECKLPAKSEFIIIDNHSTDGTGAAVNNFFSGKILDYTYKYMDENKGAGGGRNEGFKLVRGKYIYFLDDDAVIASDSRNSFFIDSLDIFEKNNDIATITTRIWDELFGFDRVVRKSKSKKVAGYHTISMLLGGSNFVRTSAFEQPLFPDFKYGYEEIFPSFVAIDKGLFNVYFAEVAVEHRPKINKWIEGSNQFKEVLCRGNAGNLAAKYLLYPALFRPLLYAVFFARWYVHLRKYKGGLIDSLRIFKEQTKGIKTKKIRYTTVIKILKEFGVGAGG